MCVSARTHFLPDLDQGQKALKPQRDSQLQLQHRRWHCRAQLKIPLLTDIELEGYFAALIPVSGNDLLWGRPLSCIHRQIACPGSTLMPTAERGGTLTPENHSNLNDGGVSHEKIKNLCERPFSLPNGSNLLVKGDDDVIYLSTNVIKHS